MIKLLKQLFTGFDNETADIAPLACAGIVLTFLGLSIFDVVWHDKPFDMQSFGIGASAVIAAVAVGLGIKNKWEAQSAPTEPPK